MSNNELMRTESVTKLLIKFSVPAIVGMIVNALYNIVDRIYIGKIGAIAMTGIGLSLPFMTLLMAFSMLVGIGAGARVSIRLGENNKDAAEKILGNALTLLVVIMTVVMVIGLAFKTPLLYLFGASEATIGYASDYITIILIGSIFQGVGFGLNNIIRAEGNPQIAMYTMLLGAITNIVLDPIFIFVFHMGIAGAAWATIISQLVSTIWVVRHFTSRRSHLVLKKSNLKLDRAVVLSIISIGMSPFFMQVAASIVSIIANNALKVHGGDIAISAMTVVNAVSIFFLMPIFGLNQGSQPVIGFNYGAKEYGRVKKALGLAIAAATTVCLLAFVLTQFFTETMIKLFNDDPTLMSVATQGMKVYLCMMPVIGFQIISSNYFQAVGKAPKSMFLSLLRQVIILIPAMLILPNIKGLGLNGVWLSGPISDLTAALVTAIFILNEMRLLHKQEILSTEAKESAISTN